DQERPDRAGRGAARRRLARRAGPEVPPVRGCERRARPVRGLRERRGAEDQPRVRLSRGFGILDSGFGKATSLLRMKCCCGRGSGWPWAISPDGLYRLSVPSPESRSPQSSCYSLLPFTGEGAPKGRMRVRPKPHALNFTKASPVPSP